MKLVKLNFDPYRSILGRVAITNSCARSQTSTATTTPALTRPPPATPSQHITSCQPLALDIHNKDRSMWNSKFSTSSSSSPPTPPPPILSQACIHNRPMSYVLGYQLFMLLSAIIALLIYVTAQERRHREELGLMSAQLSRLKTDSVFLVRAMHVHEERVDRLGEGVDKVEDAVLEMSRCVRDVLSTGAGAGAGADGQKVLEESRDGCTRVEMDQWYRTADKGSTAVKDEKDDSGGGRYGDAASMYTLTEDEDEDDWKTGTATTELELRRRQDDQWDARKHAKFTWPKYDWKGLEVFG